VVVAVDQGAQVCIVEDLDRQRQSRFGELALAEAASRSEQGIDTEQRQCLQIRGQILLFDGCRQLRGSELEYAVVEARRRRQPARCPALRGRMGRTRAPGG